MKITSVDVTQLPSGNAGSSRGAWSPVLVRVNTDEGISGGREDIRQAGLPANTTGSRCLANLGCRTCPE